MAKSKWVWIGREKNTGKGAEQDYTVSPFQDCRIRRDANMHGVYFGGDGQSISLCAKAVHRVLGIRLKPGEGPVRIKIRAELVREEE